MYRPGPSPLEPASSARERIVVFGASGHARVVMDICRLEGSYEVVGLLDSYKSRGIAYCGHEVIGSWQDLPELVSSGTVSGAIVAIGDNFSRARIVANIRGVLPDFRFVTAVHPSAQVARDVILGAGSVVMAGAVVNSGSEVGEFCIVNTRASLDHECVMGDYSSLGPGAVVGGCVRIGAYSAIGIGAVVLQETPDRKTHRRRRLIHRIQRCSRGRYRLRHPRARDSRAPTRRPVPGRAQNTMVTIMYTAIKRSLDILASLVVLVISLPLMLPVAMAIRWRMGSPVLFRHARPGFRERTFHCLKFRTMTDARDANGELLSDQERLTPLGRFLRRYSLDELPQLWNVLRGEMSLVGSQAARNALSAAVLGRAEAPPSGEARHYRLGAGQRPQCAGLGTAIRVRPVVRGPPRHRARSSRSCFSPHGKCFAPTASRKPGTPPCPISWALHSPDRP